MSRKGREIIGGEEKRPGGWFFFPLSLLSLPHSRPPHFSGPYLLVTLLTQEWNSKYLGVWLKLLGLLSSKMPLGRQLNTLFVCMCALCALCVTVHWWRLRTTCKSRFLLLSCGSWRWNLGPQTWWQVPSPTEPSLWSSVGCFLMRQPLAWQL